MNKNQEMNLDEMESQQDLKATNKLLLNMKKNDDKKDKRKDIIIIILIICLALEPIAFYAGFLWYESQFELVETYEEDTSDKIKLETEGENASIESNIVDGNQYNDSATHNEK